MLQIWASPFLLLKFLFWKPGHVFLFFLYFFLLLSAARGRRHRLWRAAHTRLKTNPKFLGVCPFWSRPVAIPFSLSLWSAFLNIRAGSERVYTSLRGSDRDKKQKREARLPDLCVVVLFGRGSRVHVQSGQVKVAGRRSPTRVLFVSPFLALFTCALAPSRLRTRGTY